MNENKIIKELAKTLCKLPISELASLKKENLKLPRSYHVQVLKHVLKEEIWNIRLQEAISDRGIGTDLFSRLEYFSDFTENMLIKLLVRLEKVKPELKEWYLENLWVMLIQVGEQLEMTEKDFDSLLGKAKDVVEANNELEDVLEIAKTLFADPEGYVDGVLKETFATTSFEGATTKELTDFGKANKLKIPTRILKKDLVTGIIENTATEKIDEEFKTSLNEMTVPKLKEYIEENKLDVITDLRKQDIAVLIAREYKPDNQNVVPIMEFRLFDLELASEAIETNPHYVSLQQELAEVKKKYELIKVKLEKSTQEEVTTEVINAPIIKRRIYWPFYALLVLFVIMAGFLITYALDRVGIMPYDSNAVSKFFYKALRFFYRLFIKFVEIFKK